MGPRGLGPLAVAHVVERAAARPGTHPRSALECCTWGHRAHRTGI